MAPLLCLRLSHSRVKPVGLRDFSLILSIKADYSFVLQASRGAECSCFHIIRNHYQHYSISRGIDLLFSSTVIIPKCGSICLYKEPTAIFSTATRTTTAMKIHVYTTYNYKFCRQCLSRIFVCCSYLKRFRPTFKRSLLIEASDLRPYYNNILIRFIQGPAKHPESKVTIVTVRIIISNMVQDV